MGHFLKIKNILRCYRITIHRSAVSTFHDPGFVILSPLSLFRAFSPSVSLPDPLFLLSRLLFDSLPGAGSSSSHAPPKSEILPLVADFTISDTRNRKFTNR
ncbi:hypothetical protein TNCV_2004641 [Trichonephila clavipes]|nr:hypothetical protein TNCV_2004641 [Trichonephila clavipes]